ncbi:BREX-1 system adenine-specific DNA-methyltransferase PglX [Paenibacillus thiaminolyticus]|uniref:BREX-1 system adenine-specific DNA-methyltransferase PglX n=1 Tax=Paenibacillus thiaminolyticus TaxID=49283 RepID=UPI00232CDF37|nr:BREX-1 system adenine-specific DNA-methyltransferase PglX [Paenibacillus thiaminolyticus]WCF07735.1 BREX-1 system adenine-specific DNA-methyltransferase PglX [Paenibacillus thiaminolyticus]
MNKTALKNFAINARKELIEKIKAKAFKIGITEESIKRAQFESSDAIYIDGKQLSATEKKQREKLISRIKEIGYKQVIEEVAYTWFNRFTALRFMEVNNYLPTKVRVLSSSNPGSSEPDIVKEALSVDLDIDKELVYELKLNNKTEELYKYLVIKQCNSLNKVLPFMFETIDSYKEILFPDGLLVKDSFLRVMTDVTAIPESDWEQVEIIGWLYQYYISEEKDNVFSNFKENVKITKETLPLATQLFTPKWIVKYMVENSLGKVWLEKEPGSPLRTAWKYYLAGERLIEPDTSYENIDPEKITFLDPCCGSGHILVYAFDLFYDMYLSKGYIEQDIPRLILEKNLFGLDIDERAVQLASFAIMMKAREKSRRVFSQPMKLNICAIKESNWIDEDVVNILINNTQEKAERIVINETIRYLKNIFWDSKVYGSMINVDQLEFELLEKTLNNLLNSDPTDLFDMVVLERIKENLPHLILQANILSSKYNVVCTNPPYMGNRNMDDGLKKYVHKNYEKSKADLCAVFIEVGLSQTKIGGYCSLVTMHSWLFLSAFEALREELLSKYTINSILHLGMEAFDGIIGKVVQTAAFIFKKQYNQDFVPTGIRLVDFYDGLKYEKEMQFFNPKNMYNEVSQSDFKKIPGSPIAYWISKKYTTAFNRAISIDSISNFTGSQNISADNDKFLRKWWEIDSRNLGPNKKWVMYSKGGSFRKHYGNLDSVIDWSDNARDFYKNNKTSNLLDNHYWYKEGITYTDVTTIGSSFRYLPPGCVFDKSGPTINEVQNLYYVLGLLNTKIMDNYLKIFNPTMHVQVKDVKNLPLLINEKILNRIEELEKENVQLSKTDWDSFETSNGFLKHPLIAFKGNDKELKSVYERWETITENSFYSLKRNEEEINKIFIELYDMNDEITPDVIEDDISIRKAERGREIKSLISFAVGCMFGRYSLDSEGLINVGGGLDQNKYQIYSPNKDNILPFISNTFLEDDLVTKIINFIETVFGEDKLIENLEYIAESLNRRDGESYKETISRYLLNEFYKDHVQIYKKRPIYWLFTSGKQKAFNCLIYMHRYDKSTLSRIRTDYLHELQIRMDTEKKSLLRIIDGEGTAKEISNAKKELKSLDLKIEELREYDEKLHHMADMQIEINLDDGVAVNYAKFEGLVAPIK